MVWAKSSGCKANKTLGCKPKKSNTHMHVRCAMPSYIGCKVSKSLAPGGKPGVETRGGTWCTTGDCCPCVRKSESAMSVGACCSSAVRRHATTKW